MRRPEVSSASGYSRSQASPKALTQLFSSKGSSFYLIYLQNAYKGTPLLSADSSQTQC